MEQVLREFGPTIAEGLVIGLIVWGGIRVKLQWLDSDVKDLKEEIKSLRETTAAALLAANTALKIIERRHDGA